MNEDELRTLYEARKPALAALGAWVVEVIFSKLEAQLGSHDAAKKFFQIQPQPRVKETDSFLEKGLIRKPKANPLADITDQVGVRFVVLLLEDIDTIGQFVKGDLWTWSKDRDHEAERLAKPDYFAYQSDHYVIHTKDVVTFKGTNIPAQMACEIQIRTILQHAYAEMAHKCDYKPSILLPEDDQKHVKRALAKGSALIETTDDVFKEITNKIRTYSEGVNALLQECRNLYQQFTGETCAASTMLSEVIADAYRAQIKNLTAEQLRAWANGRQWAWNGLNKMRNKSVFYRDCGVILVGWIVVNCEISAPSLWPLEMGFLEEMYQMMGISWVGLT